MREAGYSYSQIAHPLGLIKGTAWNWLHEGYLKRARPDLPFLAIGKPGTPIQHHDCPTEGRQGS